MEVAPPAPASASETTDQRVRHAGIAGLHVVAAVASLGALAVAHPVLDLVGTEPGFLVAHGLQPWEIALLPVVLVGAPLAAGLALALLGRWAPRAAAVAGSVLVGGGGAALTLPFLRRLPLPAGLVAVLALTAGFLTMRLFVRNQPPRSVSRALLAVPLVVVGVFLFSLPTSLWAGAAEGWPTAILEVDHPVPVVMLILDEFGAASLMDAQGRLNEGRFPAFARLAADGVWYRNAVTVETSTQRAVPAILTGKRVADHLIPNVADHPQSLFTLLSVTYQVRALEPVTDLCPAAVCATQAPTATEIAGRWRNLFGDLAVVSGHVSLPPAWAHRLPPIDQGWTGFGRTAEASDSESFDLMDRVGEAVEGDRRADVERFLTALTPGEGATRPPLTVGHLVLPHRPWELLPDGRPHGDVGPDGYNGQGWGPDPYLTAAGWRRHLLQVGFVDAAVGRVMDRLEELGVYDSSLLVVVADHGVSFEPGVEDMRVTDQESARWILPVPLFIKYPAGLGAGTVTDVRAETTDIVPTILDVLGAPAPAHLDGASLLGPVPAERTGSRVLVRNEWIPIGGGLDQQLAVARLQDAWFPDGDVWSLVPRADLRPLLGRQVSELDHHDDPGVDLVLAASPRPGVAVVEGTLELTWNPTGNEVIALVADGEIAALTQVGDIEGLTAGFSFLVHPDSAAGRGEVDAWLVHDGPILLR